MAFPKLFLGTVPKIMFGEGFQKTWNGSLKNEDEYSGEQGSLNIFQDPDFY